jgi:hypothetical protein
VLPLSKDLEAEERSSLMLEADRNRCAKQLCSRFFVRVCFGSRGVFRFLLSTPLLAERSASRFEFRFASLPGVCSSFVVHRSVLRLQRSNRRFANGIVFVQQM